MKLLIANLEKDTETLLQGSRAYRRYDENDGYSGANFNEGSNPSSIRRLLEYFCKH